MGDASVFVDLILSAYPSNFCAKSPMINKNKARSLQEFFQFLFTKFDNIPVIFTL